MKRWLSTFIATGLLLVATGALANFHLFRINQMYSNADGSVQFIVISERFGFNGEHLWAGNPLVSTHAGVNKTFFFPSNLPSSLTAGRDVLIGTQGFAALGIVTPDFVVPNGFLPTDAGSLNYAGVDMVSWTSLPTDGVNALSRQGTPVPNLASNFAGAQASISAGPAPPPAAITPVDGLWANANESGTGYTLGFKHGVLVVAIYAYQTGGAAQWYLASGPVVNNVFTATLDKYVGGQCISCTFTGRPTLTGNDGSMTITFTSSTSATVNLPNGRVTQIAPFQF